MVVMLMVLVVLVVILEVIATVLVVVTTSVVYLSEFLTTDLDARVSIPGTTRFSERYLSGSGVHSAS
jgi:hypothetical protein